MRVRRLAEPVIERLTAPDGSMRGSLYQLGALTAGDWRVASSQRLHPHEHDTLHACVVIDGAFEERDDRKATGATMCASSMVRISPPGAAHDIRFSSEGARCVVLELHGDAQELRLLTPARNLFVHAPELRGAIAGVLRDLDAGDDIAPLRAECTALALFAQTARRATLRRPGGPPPWLTRVRDRLADDPSGRLDLGALARAEGVHRVTLARAFREHFGVPVGGFVRRVRVDRARRLLLTTARPIAIVAAQAGFSDQSHLTRQLHRLLGVTPAKLRARRNG